MRCGEPCTITPSEQADTYRFRIPSKQTQTKSIAYASASQVGGEQMNRGFFIVGHRAEPKSYKDDDE